MLFVMEPQSSIEKLILGTMHKNLKDGWTAQNQGKDQRKSMTQIGG